jgi:DNA-binding CsgD family transcriptional regulator
LFESGTDRCIDHPVVAMALRLVKDARWRFGRVRGTGELIHFSCHQSEGRGLEAERFLASYRRLRRDGMASVSFVKDAVYPHAIAIWFRDPAPDISMLVILRDEAQGPFTGDECALLRLMTDFGEECLANVSLFEQPKFKPALMRRPPPLLFIIDRSYRIAIRNSPHLDDDEANAALDVASGDRLPAIIEEAVRGMTTAWWMNPYADVNAVAMPLPFLAVRAQSMDSGNKGRYLAVTVERVRARNVLQQAAERYEITPRERNVLAYLLDGMRIEEIADRLSIATSTVNDHVKSLIARTHSSNRSQMLARTLGWDGGAAGTQTTPASAAAEPWERDDRQDQLA